MRPFVMIWRAAIFLTAIKALAIFSVGYVASRGAGAGYVLTLLLSVLILPELLLSPLHAAAPTWGACLQAAGMAFLISFAASTIIVGTVGTAKSGIGKA